MANDDLIGTAEAATMIGRSSRTIHRLVKSGELVPAVTVPGGQVGVFLYHRADVQKIAEQRAPAA